MATEHLSRELCQDLERAGLDQTLGEGNWYFNTVDPPSRHNTTYLYSRDVRLSEPHLLKCPSIDTLMDECCKLIVNSEWSEILVKVYAESGEAIAGAADPEYFGDMRTTGPTRAVALARLYLKLVKERKP